MREFTIGAFSGLHQGQVALASSAQDPSAHASLTLSSPFETVFHCAAMTSLKPHCLRQGSLDYRDLPHLASLAP